MTIFSVLQAMIMTLHASLIENSSNHQINSQTKVNLRLKNGRLIHARFLIGGFLARGLGVKVKGRVEKQDCNEQ